MKLDKEILKLYKQWQEENGLYSDIDLGGIEFATKQLREGVCDFPSLSNVDGKDISIDEFHLLSSSDKTKYIPKITGTIENNQVSGYVEKERIKSLNNAISPDKVISWTRINGKQFFVQYAPVCTSDDSFVMKPKDTFSIEYICFSLLASTINSQFDWSKKLGVTRAKLLLVLVPIHENSLEIQKSLVEFVEWKRTNIQHYLNHLDRLETQLDNIEEALLAKLFSPSKDTDICTMFNRWAKKNEYTIDLFEINFEVKRIQSTNKSDLICNKRMGFTPERSANGDVNWFTISDLQANNGLIINAPLTKEKTTIELIKEAVDSKNTGKSDKLKPITKGDVLVSFKLSVGVSKVYQSDEIAYCNEAIDILTPNEGVDAKYLSYNSMFEYPLHGTNTNNGMTLNDDTKKKIRIYIPISKGGSNSLEIQRFIAEFFETFLDWKQQIKSKVEVFKEQSQSYEDQLRTKLFKGEG